ncbi:MAG: macro domain-containing protein [Chloroflexi bacterium]|nr:macro domain-containing protein [Chloroflexota bacterium]
MLKSFLIFGWGLLCHLSRTKRSLATYRSDSWRYVFRLKADAVVNAAYRQLVGGDGVDGTIRLAAGSQLRKECAIPGGCPTGLAKIPRGYQLSAKYVIHAVGSVWHGGDKIESKLLASCYRSCLEFAAEYQLTLMVFPVLSCGVYSFPANRPPGWQERRSDFLEVVSAAIAADLSAPIVAI